LTNQGHGINGRCHFLSHSRDDRGGTFLAVVVTIGDPLCFQGSNPKAAAGGLDLSTRIFRSKFFVGELQRLPAGRHVDSSPYGWTTFGDLPLTAESMGFDRP
jgi:hypothetical protein